MDIEQVELTRYELAETRGMWLHCHFGRNGRRQHGNSDMTDLHLRVFDFLFRWKLIGRLKYEN